MSAESIKVCCRFRKEFENNEENYDNWEFDEESSTIKLNQKNWTYDYILTPETTQDQMYEKVAKKTILDFTDGYNGTIFAYGQSGSGKTYSMLGPDSIFSALSKSESNELYGITPRAIYQIFNILKEFSRNGTNWKLSLSYIEIYNEKVKCLLSGKNELKIREDPHEGFVIPEKVMKDCKTPKEIFEGIFLANENRAVGATNQNLRSSRSHAIMQLELIYNSIDGLVRKSRLSLVDLAGSERIAKTGAEGQRLKEAQKINQSLTTLGMVIMALTTEGIKHVPFRNSKLTLILKDSLGGSSKTTLLCTASRLKKHTEESIQTLYFASRAKTIKNSAKKNIILNAGELQYIAKELKNEIMILRGQIKKIGYQWKLIDDKKLLNFIQNDEFILNDNNSENLKEIKKEEKDEKINEEIINKNEKNILNLNNLSEKEKDDKIEEIKNNMNIQREKLQKIIDELFIKIDNRDKEQSELENKIEDYIKQISNLQIIFQEKKNLQNKYNNLKNELSDINNNITNKDKNIEKYKNENLKINNDLLNLKKNNEIDYKKSQEEFLKYNKILIEKKEKIEILNKNILLSNEKLKNLNSYYNLIKKNNEDICNSNKSHINHLNDIINNKNSEKNLFEIKDKIYNQLINEINNNNNNILNDNNKLKIELEQLKNKISTQKNEKPIYEKLIKEKEIELKNKEENINKLKNDINNINLNLNKEIQNFSKNYEINQEQNNQINNIYKNISEKEQNLKNENINLKNSIKKLNDESLSLKQENFLLIQKYNDLIKQKDLFSDLSFTPSKENEQKKDNKNIFGVSLKKFSNNYKGINFLNIAKEEAKINSKKTEELFQNQLDLLTDLRQNIENSPKTVSSFSDLDDIPELDFANEGNDEIFKKAEEQLIKKEQEHKAQKQLKKNKV